MNHYYGNLPDGCTQADIDRAFGPSLSGDAEDALTAHHRVQTLRMTLLEAIRANDGVMGWHPRPIKRSATGSTARRKTRSLGLGMCLTIAKKSKKRSGALSMLNGA